MTENITGRYRHYKGTIYEVIGVAHHSETLEELVVYREFVYDPKYGRNPLWVRPKKMFFENVTVDDIKRPRFQRIEDNV